MIRPISSSSNAEPSPSHDSGHWLSQVSEKRSLAIGAGGLVLLFVLLMALRFGKLNKGDSQSPPAPAPATTATTPSVTTQAPPKLADSSGSVLHQVMPQVAAQAQNTIHGTLKIKVKVAVTSEGKVSRADLATRGTSAYFAQRALDAARQWTFTPPVRDGQAQPGEWVVQFEFRRSGTRAGARRV